MNCALTGKQVLMIAVAAFGTIIAVNLAMLFAATGTFPGLVVDNSYVASQSWDARHTAQRALGWHATTAWRDGRLLVGLRDADGRPVEGAVLEAVVGRPTVASEDRLLALSPGRDGYGVPVELDSGAWRVEIRTTEGPVFTVVDRIFIAKAR
jgi:nitrogen fixation protein FixH